MTLAAGSTGDGDEDAKRVFRRVKEVARALGDDAIGSRHVFLGLLDESPTVRDLLTKQGADVAALRAEVERDARPVAPAAWRGPVFTATAASVLETSLVEAQAIGDDRIRPAHLLLALMRSGSDRVREVLSRSGATLDVTRGFLAHAGGEDAGRGA